MTYVFPPSLYPLRDFMRSVGADTTAFVTDRQAAFMAQQLLGTRVKFPPKGQEMTPTLLTIQKGIVKIPTPSTKDRSKAISAAADQILKDGRKGKRKRSSREHLAIAKPRPDFSPAVFATGVHVFADGAAIPNPGAGGWGVVVYRDGVEIDSAYGGEAETTNNRMEMTALLKAIELLSERYDELREATIWCDSQYCVSGANDWRHKWKRNGWKRNPNSPEPVKNVDLWKAVDEALTCITVKETQISIRWVKGHVGIIGNERADELAELGRKGANLHLYLNGYETPADDLDAQYRAIMAG